MVGREVFSSVGFYVFDYKVEFFVVRIEEGDDVSLFQLVEMIKNTRTFWKSEMTGDYC